MRLPEKSPGVYPIEKYDENMHQSLEIVMVPELLNLRDMEQALNPQDFANDQPIITRLGFLLIHAFMTEEVQP
ncbi:MAG: hypothetical protein AB7T38_17805 [Nitrospirales bacterium]